jgi:hypothetical protein
MLRLNRSTGASSWRGMTSPPVVFRGYTAKSLAEQIREHEARQR